MRVSAHNDLPGHARLQSSETVYYDFFRDDGARKPSRLAGKRLGAGLSHSVDDADYCRLIQDRVGVIKVAEQRLLCRCLCVRADRDLCMCR